MLNSSVIISARISIHRCMHLLNAIPMSVFAWIATPGAAAARGSHGGARPGGEARAHLLSLLLTCIYIYIYTLFYERFLQRERYIKMFNVSIVHTYYTFMYSYICMCIYIYTHVSLLLLLLLLLLLVVVVVSLS